MHVVNKMMVVAAGLLILPACFGDNLAGDWGGEVDCGEDAQYDMKWELEDKDGLEFSGTGELESLCAVEDQIVPCEIVFDIVVEKDKKGGEQDVNVDLDDCELEGVDYECDDIDDAEFDGKTVIIGEIEVGTLVCDFEMELD